MLDYYRYDNTGLGVALLFLGIACAFAAYTLPAIIGSTRQHPYAGAVWILNLMTGWTVICWIVLTIWVFVEKPLPAAQRSSRPAPQGLPTPQLNL